MADVAGTWECVTKTPMGEQKTVMTVVPGPDGTFTGSSAGPGEALELLDGKIDGSRLTWRMEMKVPMPMTLEADATVDGDTMTGGVKAGMFGTSPMTGKRTG